MNYDVVFRNPFAETVVIRKIKADTPNEALSEAKIQFKAEGHSDDYKPVRYREYM